MILHIVRKNDVPYDICKSFADKLCSLYNGVIIRIIDYDTKDTILNNSTSDSEIYMSLSEEDIIKASTDDKRLLLSVGKNSTADKIVDACKTQLDTFIVQKDIFWIKNENGWWYQVDRNHHGGILDMVTRINGKWYCIGTDYYMKTGWVPVEINEEFSCLYFDPVDGNLNESKDRSDIPDPFSFSYAPIKVKWY